MKKLFLTSLIAMILAMSFSSCGDDGTTEFDGFEIYCIYENATSVNLELIKKGVDTLIVKVNSAVTDTKYDDLGGSHSFVKSQSRIIIYGDSLISIDDSYRFNFNNREKTSDHSANEYYIFTDSLLTNIKDSMAVRGIFPKKIE